MMGCPGGAQVWFDEAAILSSALKSCQCRWKVTGRGTRAHSKVASSTLATRASFSTKIHLKRGTGPVAGKIDVGREEHAVPHRHRHVVEHAHSMGERQTRGSLSRRKTCENFDSATYLGRGRCESSAMERGPATLLAQ